MTCNLWSAPQDPHRGSQDSPRSALLAKNSLCVGAVGVDHRKTTPPLHPRPALAWSREERGGLWESGFFAVHAVVEGADHQGAADDVAGGGKGEVSQEGVDGHLGSGEHAAGDEEHVGYAVFVAQDDECGHRYPAGEGFLSQGGGRQAQPYGQTHAPVGAYAAQQYLHGGQRSLCLRYLAYGIAVDGRIDHARGVGKEPCEEQGAHQIAQPHIHPVAQHGQGAVASTGQRRDEQGVVAGEQFAAEVSIKVQKG